MLVVPNGDPVLAAEPVFHEPTPSGVEGVAVPFGHGLSNLPELLKDLTENPVPRGGVKADVALGVMVNLARGQTTEAAQAAVIEFVGGQFDFQGHGHIFDQRLGALFIEGGFEVAHAALDGSVVARIAWRAVKGQDPVAFEHFIDGLAVEG